MAINPKITASYSSDWRVSTVGLSAFGLHCRVIAWLGANESATQGVVPESVATGFGPAVEIDALVKVGLWESVVAGEIRLVEVRVGDDRSAAKVVAIADGWYVPDYLRLNPTRGEREGFIAEQRRKSGLATKARAAKKEHPPVGKLETGGPERTGLEEKGAEESGVERRGLPSGGPTEEPAATPPDELPHPKSKRARGYDWEPDS